MRNNIYSRTEHWLTLKQYDCFLEECSFNMNNFLSFESCKSIEKCLEAKLIKLVYKLRCLLRMRDYCSRGVFGEYVSEHHITGGDRWIENDCCLSTPTAFLLDNCEQSHGITSRKQLIIVYIQYFPSLGFGIFIYLFCSDIQLLQRPGDNRVRVVTE